MAQKCEFCGGNTKAYWHALSPGLIGALIKMIGAVKKKNQNKVHLQKDLNLTKNEYANFQKLRFHALVAKSETRGLWVITARGGQFLRGEIRIPNKVQTFRNKIVEKSPEMVGMADYRDKVSWFQKDFEAELKGITGIGNSLQNNLFAQVTTLV